MLLTTAGCPRGGAPCRAPWDSDRGHWRTSAGRVTACGCSLLYAARLIAGHGSRPSHPKPHLPHSGILEAIVCQINSRTVVPRDRSPTSPPGPSPVPAATPTPPAPRRSIHLLVVRMAHPAAATPREEGAAAVAAGPTMAAQGRNTRLSRSCLPLVCPRRSVV